MTKDTTKAPANSRRSFLGKLAAAGAAAGAAFAAPKAQAQTGPITMRFQSTWPAKDIFARISQMQRKFVGA